MYAAYVPRVMRAIHSHTFYGGAIPESENPFVDYRIELLPDGTVTGIVLKQSSGYPTFDESVRLGILQASPLPTRDDGKSELRLEIRFRMKK
jgi:colicin import membrane protein